MESRRNQSGEENDEKSEQLWDQAQAKIKQFGLLLSEKDTQISELQEKLHFVEQEAKTIEENLKDEVDKISKLNDELTQQNSEMLKDLEKAEQKAFIDESLKQEHEVCMDDDDSNDISRGMTSPDALAASAK